MRVRDEILTEYTGDTTGFRRSARDYDRILERQLGTTKRRLGELDRRWERSNRAILMVRSSVLALSAGLGVAQVRQYAESWRQVERSLTAIGETSTGSQQALVDLALRTRAEVSGTARAVQRLSRSTGGDLDTTIRRVETLQKLLATNGAAGSERASVSLQLGQALQSGVLSGDEFRSISENAPAEFLDALAAAAGVTRQELKATAQEQQLTTEVVLEALDSLAITADKSFSRIAISGEEAIDVLSTGLTAYVGSLDDTLGATATLNNFLASVGETLATNTEGAKTLAAALQFVGVAAAATVGSRSLGGMVMALQQASRARLADVAAARQQITIADAERRSRRANLDSANRRIRQLHEERAARLANGQAVKRVSNQIVAAEVAQAKAIDRLRAAEDRRTMSVNALSAAQQRLSVATRISTRAVSALNGVVGFFGGPVGLAFTAVTGVLAVMAARTEDVERLTQRVTDRVGDLKSAYAAVGGEVETLRARVAATSLAGAITDAEELERQLARVQSLTQRTLDDFYRGPLERRPELQDLVQGLVDGNLRADEFRAALNGLVAEGDEAFARLVDHLEGDVLRALIDVTQSSDEAEDVLAILRGTSDEAAAAMERLGLRAGNAGATVDQLAASAEAAAKGIAGLVAQIPELQRAQQVQERIAKATEDRRVALEGLNGLSGNERVVEERRILELYQRAVAEIDGSADATRRANSELDRYLDQSRLNALDARGAALAREAQQYDSIVKGLQDAQAGEEALAAAREAHAQNVSSIEERFSRRPSSAGGGAPRVSGSRDLLAVRESLIEVGQGELVLEAALNAERERLIELMPTLISMGLSQAEAQEVVAAQLQRVREGHQDVETAAQRSSEAFARGILDDIRSADSLTDAIGRVSDRLLDLAADSAFDQLAQQFSRLAVPSGSGGFFQSFLGGLFGGARAGGGRVQAGRGYIINENTPRSEMFFPEVSGVVTNVAQAQAALSQTSASAAQVNVSAGDVVVNVINQSSASVSAERGPGGRVDITVRDQFRNVLQSGALDSDMKRLYGLNRRAQGA